jgi:hypothetical protein
LLIDKSITKALCNEAEIEEVRYMEKTIWTKSPPAIIVNVTDTSWFDKRTYSQTDILPLGYAIKNLKDTQSAWIAMPLSAEYGRDFQLVAEIAGLTLKQYTDGDTYLKTDKWQFISLRPSIEGSVKTYVANTTSSMAPKLKAVIIDKSTHAEEKEILKKLVL